MNLCWQEIFAICSIVLITYTIEGITGFGSTILALPFISMIVGIDNAVPLLCPLNCVLSSYIVATSYRNVSWRKFGFIVLHVGLGVPLGLYLFSNLPKTALIILLAAFMLFVSIKGLLKTIAKKNGKETAMRAGNMAYAHCPVFGWHFPRRFFIGRAMRGHIRFQSFSGQSQLQVNAVHALAVHKPYNCHSLDAGRGCLEPRTRHDNAENASMHSGRHVAGGLPPQARR